MTRLVVILTMLAPLLASCGPDDMDSAPIVARIQASGCGPVPAIGSGVVVDDGLVLTVAHVVAGAGDIEVTAGDGIRYEAVIAAIDTEKDVAVLKVSGLTGHGLEVAEMAAGAQGRFTGFGGDDAGVVGFTVRRRVTIRINDIYDAVASSRQGLEIEASVDPGDSGAALLDSRGRLVGMVFAASRRSADVGYATATAEFEGAIETARFGAVTAPVRCRP